MSGSVQLLMLRAIQVLVRSNLRVRRGSVREHAVPARLQRKLLHGQDNVVYVHSDDRKRDLLGVRGPGKAFRRQDWTGGAVTGTDVGGQMFSVNVEVESGSNSAELDAMYGAMCSKGHEAAAR
eukprot:758577-Hanusia_phi.AAC.5